MNSLNVIRTTYGIYCEKEEYGAFCECGKTLIFKMPEIKDLYKVTCPNCGKSICIGVGKYEEGGKLNEIKKD